MTLQWQPIGPLSDPDEAEYRGDPADLLDAVDLLLTLADKPPWMADAACKEHPELNWWPTRGEDVTQPKAVCAACLVRDDCIAYALTLPSSEDGGGIWGGTSARQRRQLRKHTTVDKAA